MNPIWLLQPFLAGSIFFVGAAAIAIAAWGTGRWARAVVLAGAVLMALSAVPVVPMAYACLGLVIAGWFWAIRRPLSGSRALRVALALVAAVLVLTELPYHLRSPIEIRPGARVLVLGDSLAAGDAAWPGLLFAGADCRIENRAYPGARLADGAGQLRDARQPCEVLIALGGNDLLGGATVPAFEASLESLLRDVISRGCRGTMLELPLLPLQNGYGRAQRRLAREYQIALVPRRLLAAPLTTRGHTTDGLHLSPSGHRALATELSGLLRCSAR